MMPNILIAYLAMLHNWVDIGNSNNSKISFLSSNGQFQVQDHVSMI